jgi:lysophospholipase L1-like esterase
MRCTRIERWSLMMAISLSLYAATVSAKDDPPASATAESRASDAGWMKRHESMNERIKKGNVDLLMIGDSITHAWEKEGKEVWKKYYEKRNAVNLGIGGDRTQQVIWRLENGNIEGISPKLAVLMIGTNNSRLDTPEDIAAGVKAIVEKLRTQLPEMKILVLAIFPRGENDNNRLRKVNNKTNEAIAKFADDKMVFFLDINEKFLTPEHILSKEIMPDLLHPNEKGYEIWAEAMEPTVAKLLGEEPVK